MKFLRNILYTFLLVMSANVHSFAQQITSYEYWFDDAVNDRKTTNVNSAAEVQLQAQLDVANLKAGVHTLHIRFKDSQGRYSSVASSIFIKNGDKIVKYEYWLDNDYTKRKTVNPSPTGELNLTQLDVKDLASGFHTLHSRYFDNTGLASSIATIPVFLSQKGVGIVRYEYWFDNDRQTLIASDVPLTNPYAFTRKLTGLTLPFGDHVLHTRFADANGQWSAITSDTFEVCKMTVRKVESNKAGNTGLASLFLHGVCFQPKMKATLIRAGEAPIEADTVISLGGRLARGIFNLVGAKTGVWDLVLTAEGEVPDTLKQALTIEEGIKPELWTEVMGRDRIRIGTESVYTITYGNKGNVDALFAPMWIAVSKQATVSIEADVYGFDERELSEMVPYKITAPTLIPIDSLHGSPFQANMMCVMLPYIPGGYTGSIKLRIKAPDNQQVRIVSWMTEPLLTAQDLSVGKTGEEKSSFQRFKECVYTLINNPKTQEYLQKKLYEILKNELDELFGGDLAKECVVPIVHQIIQEAGDIFIKSDDPAKGEYLTKQKVLDLACFFGQAIFKCFKSAGKKIPFVKAIKIGLEVIPVMSYLYSTIYDCYMNLVPTQTPKAMIVQPVQSLDPNEKNGARGLTEKHFIATKEDLRYTIFFENKDTIINGAPTVPVHECVILDTLELAKLDMNTFRFLSFGFGDSVYYAGIPGVYEDKGTLDLRPAKNAIVEYNLSVNRTTGIVRWHFRTLDPVTMAPMPDDPDFGFLPPNTESPEGEGFVSFSVRPKANLSTATTITNRAGIYFDANAPIITNYWSNTFDFATPTSRATKAETLNDSTIKVSVQGTDVGSGLNQYEIWASIDNQAYELIRVVPAGSATYDLFVAKGKCYSMYTIAVDSAGNREMKTPAEEAKTCTSAILSGYYSSITCSLYPNPVTHSATLRISQAPAALTYTVTDVSGKVLMRQSFSRIASEFETQIDFSHLPAGLYFVNLEGEGRMTHLKVVRQ